MITMMMEMIARDWIEKSRESPQLRISKVNDPQNS